MKILIVSDTHGKDDNFVRVLKKENDAGLLIHLGDLCGLESHIEKLSKIPCYCVRGNNDYRSLLPDESIIMLGKYRCFITHGHDYGVYYGTRILKEHARALDCRFAMYGHTHFPEIDESGSVTVLNPGSLTFPRQPDHKPSYIVATTDDDGEVSFELRYL